MARPNSSYRGARRNAYRTLGILPAWRTESPRDARFGRLFVGPHPSLVDHASLARRAKEAAELRAERDLAKVLGR